MWTSPLPLITSWFPKVGVPQNGWFIMGWVQSINGWLGVPLLLKTTPSLRPDLGPLGRAWTATAAVRADISSSIAPCEGMSARSVGCSLNDFSAIGTPSSDQKWPVFETGPSHTGTGHFLGVHVQILGSERSCIFGSGSRFSMLFSHVAKVEHWASPLAGLPVTHGHTYGNGQSPVQFDDCPNYKAKFYTISTHHVWFLSLELLFF